MYNLIMVMSQIDNPTKFIFLFQIFSVIILTVLHHFLCKEHKKFWLLLCAIPFIVFIVFYAFNIVKGNEYIGYQRYIGLGMMSVLIFLWGLASYFLTSYKIYTILIYILSIACIVESLIVILVTNFSPHLVNLSNYGWSESFEKTIDEFEKSYISRDWKEIDFDALRAELIPKVKKAEEENNKVQFAAAVYELKYKLFDGHIRVDIKDAQVFDEVKKSISGNNYGFVMFKDDAGEFVAVLADKTGESAEMGIHDGTIITKWDNVPVEEAVLDVKCIDDWYTFAYIENEEIVQPIFLSGVGGEEIAVSFINDDGEEKQVILHSKGSFYSKVHSAIGKIYNQNVKSSNYYTCMLNDDCGYLRIKNEAMYQGDINEHIHALGGDYQMLREDLEAKIEELENQGMKRMIIDIRNNTGGYSYISQNIASLFVDEAMAPEAGYYKNGKYELYEKPRLLGNGRWSNIPIAVIVNGETCSAGDCLAYWLSKGDNTHIVGNTYQWGCAQATGGICILSNDFIEIRYPIYPSLTNECELIAEPKGDRKARVKLDYQITYDREAVLELFGNSTDDDILNKTIEYIASFE